MACNYVSPDGNKCGRESFKRPEFCKFHVPYNDQFHLTSDQYIEAIRGLIENGDGNWVGFIFPDNLNIAKCDVNIELDLRWATFKAVRIDGAAFDGKINLSFADFMGPLQIRGTLNAEINATESDFRDEVTIGCRFNGPAVFSGAKFNGRTRFTSRFHDTFRLSGAIFRDSATFQGGYDITIVLGGGKDANKPPVRNTVFYDIAYLDDVDFQRPQNTRFILTDMRNALIGGTNLRGIQLQDVEWYQSSLKRRGLYDECFARDTTDKSFLPRQIPRLYEQCRNVRLALEESRDFVSAADFYVAEMDYRRLQYNSWLRRSICSLEAIYRHLSLYGTAPIRAALWLVLIIAAHMLIISIAVDDSASILKAVGYELSKHSYIDTYHTILALFTNSLKSLMTIRGQPPVAIGGGIALSNTLFQLMAAVQIALLVLALRAKIKRN